MAIYQVMLVGCLFCGAFAASAAEVSLVKGVYRSREYKKPDNYPIDSVKVISLGGRYSDRLSGPLDWYAQAEFGTVSYSGDAAPSNANDFEVGGGVMFRFNRFSEQVTPYLIGGGAFSEKTVNPLTANPGERRIQLGGLSYLGGVGLRLKLESFVFLSFEAKMFEHFLFGTEKEIGNNGDVVVEAEHFDVYFDTFDGWNSVQVIFGAVF